MKNKVFALVNAAEESLEFLKRICARRTEANGKVDVRSCLIYGRACMDLAQIKGSFGFENNKPKKCAGDLYYSALYTALMDWLKAGNVDSGNRYYEGVL